MIRKSSNPAPHFEKVQGRRVFYDGGWPALVLTVEIPWWKLVHGRYRETMRVYDHLYPAAAKMGLTALKVPVKWSMVEPQRGRYDFSYLDHVVKTARRNGLRLVIGWFGHYASGDGTIYRNLTDEVFAPMHVIEDDGTYPRAVDGDGVPHHNAASYACGDIVRDEVAAFRAFMRHMRKIDGRRRTVQMIQVENEIAQFGADRENRKQWRDHRPEADRLFRKWKYRKGTDELVFTARMLAEKWLAPLTRAGKSEYPLPQFLNYVSGLLGGRVTGGAPGEDVATHLAACPALDFIGRNLYMRPNRTVAEMRAAIREWCVAGNIPAITETNSGTDAVAPRLAFLSIGEFGAPVFAPWALNISYPGAGVPYVLEDGSLANGAFALRDAYRTLRLAPAQVAWHAATDRLLVFMSEKPGEDFRRAGSVGGIRVEARGWVGGQAIVIRTGERELLFLGYRTMLSVSTGFESWPRIKRLRVEQGEYRDGVRWVASGVPKYGINQSRKRTYLVADGPTAVRISWGI
jgi:hypothetical protein